MFLSKIELVGFKSFANKTSLNFDGGITAIIGPNGCGKTNIVDAVRWVLGEQRTSILRSVLMENVIFNGSSSRKPLGLAEVSITFQNDKGILPIQYNEITVTRRLYRDGKSDYLINNNLCRLKDITELFADTGIGHNSYSIIELKMVETLLNGTVEERRKLLEEAAGISKYKQRKKETVRKLESVQNDLLRIYDLVNEIEGQVRSLSRQAAKMRKYNRLYQELKELEINFWNLKFIQSNEIVNQYEEENAKLLEENQQKKDLLNQILEEIDNLQTKIDSLETELENVRFEESQSFKKLFELDKKIGVENERVANLNSLEKKLQSEITDTHNLIVRFNKTLNELLRLKELKTNELMQLRKESTILYSYYEQNQKRLLEKRSLLNEINDRRIVLSRDLKIYKLNLDKLISSLNLIDEKKDKISSAIKELELKISEKSKYSSVLEAEVVLISNQVEGIRQRISEFEEALQVSSESLKNEKEKHNQILISLKEVQTSLELLKSIFEVDETTKFLIKDSEWKKDRTFNLLGEIISIDEEYRVAFDSLLGQYKNIILVQSENDIQKAREILLKEHKGKCLFVNLNCIPETPITVQHYKHPKIIAYASELPNVDLKIRNLLRIVLGDAVLVKDFDDALFAAANTPCKTVVTLSGEMIINGIVYKRGSIYQGEGLAIGKVERIRKLEKKYDELILELKNAETLIESLEKENISVLDELRKHRNLLKQEESKLYQKKTDLNEQKIILERYKQELISKQTSINEINDEKNQLRDEINQLRKVLVELQEKLAEIEKEWRDKEFELKTL
ncbi:MAG: AAA family ATPase, partial [Candidatus Kapaibacteriota bacterium]